MAALPGRNAADFFRATFRGSHDLKRVPRFMGQRFASAMEEVLERLPGREQAIILLRFGLVDGHQRTFREVGREMGISATRVRQLDVRALRKLCRWEVVEVLAAATDENLQHR